MQVSVGFKILVVKMDIRDCVTKNSLRRYLYIGPDGAGWIMGLVLLDLWSVQSNGSRVLADTEQVQFEM